MFVSRRFAKLSMMAVVLIFLLFFLHFIGILRPVENGVIYLTRPMVGGVYRASDFVGGLYANFQTKRAVLRENKELKDRVAMLITQTSACLEEKEENDFLRKQLQFSEDKRYDYEIARVIGHSPDNIQNTLIIDRGGNRGLSIGQPVLSEGGFLIGKIINTKGNIAHVLMINDDLSKVAVKIQNQAKTIGIAEGEYGLGIKINLIPQAESIKEGDIVVTSGLEAGVPPGLILGEVKQVAKEPEEMFQSAAIDSPIDFNRIMMVSVIKGIMD